MDRILLLALLLHFAGNEAFCQTVLPFVPNQIQTDNEQDSLYHYSGASKTYVVAARPPRDPNYNKGNSLLTSVV